MANLSPAECLCCYCCDRRLNGGTPYHLKSYDDSAKSTPAVKTPLASPPLGEGEKIHYILSKADCGCESCLRRLRAGKLPVHLKKFDDTVREAQGRICVCTDDCCIVVYGKICADGCTCKKCDRKRLRSFREFESVYLDFVGPEILIGGLDYDDCTPKELKKFIGQRGLKDPFPGGLTLKSFYIPILNAADRAPTFRFLDLPAEMKNAVFYELLTRPVLKGWQGEKQFGPCYPQILSVNREVNNDAKDIIYAQNTLVCEFLAKYTAAFAAPTTEITLNNRYTYVSGTVTDPSRIIKSSEVPADSMFTKIYALEIYVGINNDNPFTNAMEAGLLQNTLLIFASSLMGRNKLKDVNIHFSSTLNGVNRQESTLAEVILYPLRRLRGIANVKVTGDLTPELAVSIKKDMQSNEPAHNTGKDLRSTWGKCKPHFDLMNSLGFGETEGVWGLFDNVWNMRYVLSEFDESPWEPVVSNEALEANLRRMMDDLLKNIPPMEYLRKFQSVLEAMD